jgi:hypothetical protein
VPERYQTPVDEETGLPYCFVPPNDLPPVKGPGEANIERLADWNHQFPRADIKYGNNPVISGIASMALLNLRGQWVDYRQHHDVYNPLFDNPRQPQTTNQLSTTLIMGLAGSVPEGALDLSREAPQIVSLSPKQRQNLWMSGQVRVLSTGEVSRYLFDHVFDQELDYINDDELVEFLCTFDWERRIFLGHRIAAKIVERAVEPVAPIYKAAHRQGDLHPAVPAHPRDFVKRKLTRSGKFGPVFNELHHRLGPERRRRELPTAWQRVYRVAA